MRRFDAQTQVQAGPKEGARGETRGAILAVAERMFAEHGVAGVSLRAIISEAGANTAAVHYHFGSKDNLVAEVFLHRAGLIAEERKRLLSMAMEERPGRVRLEAIVRAFLKPGLLGGADSAEAARRYATFRAKLLVETSDLVRNLMAQSFNETSRAFVEALVATLPAFPHDEILWRVHSLLGIMVYTMADAGRITSISAGACNPSDHSAALDRLVPIGVDIFAPGLPPA